jgi:RNA polymerase sigma-70 factor (ECF subfamily)
MRLPMTTRTSASNAQLEALWHEMHGPLSGFIARRVGRPGDVDDVLQEVMLRIHRHAGDLDRVEHVTAWVYQVTRSAVVDYHRRRAARPEVPAEIADEVDETRLFGSEPDAATEDVRSELAPCLAPLLARLPDKHRRAMQLTELEGLSQVEAARRLELSTSGMKARVQRGRKQLRDLLLECCHVELDRRGAITDYEPRSGACSCCDAKSGK